jgi:hypothetical protein
MRNTVAVAIRIFLFPTLKSELISPHHKHGRGGVFSISKAQNDVVLRRFPIKPRILIPHSVLYISTVYHSTASGDSPNGPPSAYCFVALLISSFFSSSHVIPVGHSFGRKVCLKSQA